jgi:hypothetical protein
MRTVGGVQGYLQRSIKLGRAMILIVQSECADDGRPFLSYVQSLRRCSTRRDVGWEEEPGTHL